MKNLSYFVILLFVLGCSPRHYLSEEELHGVRIKGGLDTTGITFFIEATSVCPTSIIVWVGKGDHEIKINGRTTEKLYHDLYEEVRNFRIEYDTNCIKIPPKVSFFFHGTEGEVLPRIDTDAK